MEVTPLSVDTLFRLLASVGIDLHTPEHANTLNCFRAMPSSMQWEAVESVLALQHGKRPCCPICRELLPTGERSIHGPAPADLFHHICDCIEGLGNVYAASGKDFSVSSSMLGK